MASLMARFEQKKGGKAGKGHGRCHVVPVPDADGRCRLFSVPCASQPEESKPSPKPVAKHVAAPVTEPVAEPVTEPVAKHVAEHVTPSVSEAPKSRKLPPSSFGQPADGPMKLPSGVPTPTFNSSAERANAWAAYGRSLKPVSGHTNLPDDKKGCRGPHSDKADEDMIAKLTTIHKKSSTSPYGFIAARNGQESLLLNVITPRLFNKTRFEFEFETG